MSQTDNSKKLSKVISREIFIKPRYVNARFMKSKVAFKSIDNSEKALMTAKFVEEKNCPIELQIHVRLDGRDYFNKMDDLLDVDIYIEKEKLQEFIALINEVSA